MRHDTSKCKVFKESVFNQYLTFYFRKNHYLIEAVNENIFAIQQAGLIKYWIDVYEKSKASRSAEEIGPKVMSLHDLSGTFKVWVIGLFISACIFVLEVLFKFICKLVEMYLESYFRS